jgi:hypothetical protein
MRDKNKGLTGARWRMMRLSQAAEFKGLQLGIKIRGKINVLNKQFNFLRLTHINLLSQMKRNLK